MRSKSLLIIGAYATGTVALLAAVAPVSLDAGSNSAPATIQTPMLKTSGCELSMVCDLPNGQPVKPGTRLPVTLVMFNPTKDSVELPYSVHFDVSRPAPAMSRTPLIYETQWSQNGTCTLGPGERKELALNVTRRLAPGERGMFMLARDKEQIAALSLYAAPDDTAKPRAGKAANSKRIASADRQSKSAVQ